jgi:hypothetical protein
VEETIAHNQSKGPGWKDAIKTWPINEVHLALPISNFINATDYEVSDYFWWKFQCALVKYFTIVVSILIIIAVLIPGSNIPSVNFVGIDKIVHVSMFAAWAVAMRIDFDAKLWQIFVLGLVFSLFTELLQLFVEGRTFDSYDMIADAAGLLLGLLVSKPIKNFIMKILNVRN